MARIPSLLKSVVANAFRRPATVKYPYQRLEPPKGFRGRHEVDWEKCIGCGVCARDCPALAIELVETPKGLKPLIDLSRCIFCYQCADSCPRGAISSTIVFELASWHREELYVKPPGMSVAGAA